MSEPIRVVLNPTAGGGAARRLRSEVEREVSRLGRPVAIDETTAAGDAAVHAREAALAGAPAVIAVGGDGTVHEVANGLLAAREAGVREVPVLGVVPVGSGNDFAKLLGCGPDRSKAYALLRAGHVRRFDAGRVRWEGGEEFFVNGFGTGIDVEVVRQALRPPRFRGVFGYLIAVLRALAVYDPLPLRIRLDGREWHGKVMIVAVGNGCCQAGGFYVWPDAVADDGWLDVCVVDELSKAEVTRVLPRVLRGRHVGTPKVEMYRAGTIEIEAVADRPLFFQLDGELREPAAASRVTATVERGVLPVFAASPGGPQMAGA